MKRMPIVLTLVLAGMLAIVPGCGQRPTTVYVTPAPSNGNVTVWVNTKTRTYHYPGSRYYGRTNNGTFMTEAQAQSNGFRPAQNGQ